MKTTPEISQILKNYESESPALLARLYCMLNTGKLAGTGKMVILPVDQGFEHGPDRSFAKNPDGYDPEYHYGLAIKAQMNAYAAPLGFISSFAGKYAGQIPTILKINSNNSLFSKDIEPNQIFTSSAKDALELGCSAIGITIYPGSNNFKNIVEEAKEHIREAKSLGLLSIVWSYPRGAGISKQGETAVDVCAYAAHIAAQIGAHIIKVKPPTDFVDQEENRKIFAEQKIDLTSAKLRISHVVRSCFNGKRIVIFSGGAAKSENEILEEVKSINEGGGNGSIIGRNSFQRPLNESLELLDKICKIYKS
jgi:fructose-bisphosphate aldolase, class I